MTLDWTEFEKMCAALCAWREARNQGRDGIRGVIHVIDNRSHMHTKTWAEVVYQPLQFSSMTYPHDPQLSLVPKPTDAEFEMCYEVADLVWKHQDPDNTNGADHYFNPNIVLPDWAAGMQPTVQIGDHSYYKSA
jgi:N-acetylmuramoyl-L-alanine amidase